MILTLSESRQETEHVRTFGFQPNIDFMPGQFIILEAEINGEAVKRAYSISSSPLDKYLELTVELVPNGKMTSYLFNSLRPGSKIKASPPQGNFYYKEGTSVSMIAGGSGVTPMRSIIRYCGQKKLGTDITLLCSSKTMKEILFKEEFEQLSKSNQKLTVIHTLTRESPVHWKGELGRINREMIGRSFPNLKGDLFYICGPAEMVKSLSAILSELGIEKGRIKKDVWGV